MLVPLVVLVVFSLDLTTATFLKVPFVVKLTSTQSFTLVPFIILSIFQITLEELVTST